MGRGFSVGEVRPTGRSRSFPLRQRGQGRYPPSILRQLARSGKRKRLPGRKRRRPASARSLRDVTLSLDSERLVGAAKALDDNAYLVALLGGEAGLRCGEIIARSNGAMWISANGSSVSSGQSGGHMTAPKVRIMPSRAEGVSLD